MIIYMINLLIVYISACMSMLFRKKDLSKPIGYKPNNFFTMIAVISLTLVSGFRYQVGTDFSTYEGLFSYFYQLDFKEISRISFSDKGFVLLSWIVGKFNNSPQAMFFASSLIITLLIVFTLKEYADPFELALYLYITTFSYYSSFNGLRQCLAATIIFAGFSFLIQRKWKQYFIIVLIASSFHLSALIMIPFYFFANNDIWTYKQGILIVLFSGCFLFYNGFIDQAFSIFLKDTIYGHYNSILTNLDNGANFLRAIVWSIPLIISYIYRRKIIENKSYYNYIVNLSLIGFLFMFLAVRNALIARLSFYFELYNIILIASLTKIFNAKDNKLLYIIIFASYFIYSYVLLPRDSNVLPYRFFFQN